MENISGNYQIASLYRGANLHSVRQYALRHKLRYLSNNHKRTDSEGVEESTSKRRKMAKDFEDETGEDIIDEEVIEDWDSSDLIFPDATAIRY